MSKFKKFLDVATNGPARVVDGTLNLVDKGIGKALTSDISKRGAKTGYGMVKKDPLGKNFSNAYTGFQEGPTLVLGTAAVTGTYAWAGDWKARRITDQTGEVSYTGTAPIHNYDGVSSAPTLGAQGSMVFGMHQGRKR